jgi:hypothetical protein
MAEAAPTEEVPKHVSEVAKQEHEVIATPSEPLKEEVKQPEQAAVPAPVAESKEATSVPVPASAIPHAATIKSEDTKPQETAPIPVEPSAAVSKEVTEEPKEAAPASVAQPAEAAMAQPTETSTTQPAETSTTEHLAKETTAPVPAAVPDPDEDELDDLDGRLSAHAFTNCYLTLYRCA